MPAKEKSIWAPVQTVIRPGESTEDAARRCLREELGINVQADQLQQWQRGGYITICDRPRIEQGSSWSYPGLNARYWCYDLTIDTDQLPEFADLGRQEVCWIGERGDAVIEHDWEWEDPKNVQPLTPDQTD